MEAKKTQSCEGTIEEKQKWIFLKAARNRIVLGGDRNNKKFMYSQSFLEPKTGFE